MKDVKEVMNKLEEISRDIAVIKTEIKHINYKLETMEKVNHKQDKDIENVKEKVNSLNMEIVKIASIVSIVALGIGSVITGVISKVLGVFK